MVQITPNSIQPHLFNRKEFEIVFFTTWILDSIKFYFIWIPYNILDKPNSSYKSKHWTILGCTLEFVTAE